MIPSFHIGSSYLRSDSRIYQFLTQSHNIVKRKFQAPFFLWAWLEISSKCRDFIDKFREIYDFFVEAQFKVYSVKKGLHDLPKKPDL